MRRMAILAGTACVLFALETSATAGGPVRTVVRKAYTSVVRDYRRNNSWPQNFVPQDRAAVRAPFCTMIANGWRLQNTLGDHHFGDDNATLSSAGELKIRNILHDSPIDARTIFVLRGANPEITAARIANAEAVAQKFLDDEDVPLVVETRIRPRGWAAEISDDTFRQFRATTPAPRLPASTDASATSTSGS